jgi:hypothetical protein
LKPGDFSSPIRLPFQEYFATWVVTNGEERVPAKDIRTWESEREINTGMGFWLEELAYVQSSSGGRKVAD